MEDLASFWTDGRNWREFIGRFIEQCGGTRGLRTFVEGHVAQAASELAIICQIWPRPIDVVLRPGEIEYRSWFTPRGSSEE